MRGNKVRFVYFDLGGVMFSFEPGFKRIADRASTSPVEVKKFFCMYDDAACRGEITTEDLLLLYKNHMKIEPPISSFLEFWVDSFVPYYDMHTLAYRISLDFKIGLLTNIYTGVYERVFEDGLIPQLEYDAVIRSCDYAIVKPDQQIYEIAEKKAGLSSEEILFIDDNVVYVEQASRLGWNTIHFDSRNSTKSIEEIVDLLGL